LLGLNSQDIRKNIKILGKAMIVLQKCSLGLDSTDRLYSLRLEQIALKMSEVWGLPEYEE